MTYRELLKLYKQGKLEDSTKKQIEAEIEKQDAISEFLYEEGANIHQNNVKTATVILCDIFSITKYCNLY